MGKQEEGFTNYKCPLERFQKEFGSTGNGEERIVKYWSCHDFRVKGKW